MPILLVRGTQRPGLGFRAAKYHVQLVMSTRPRFGTIPQSSDVLGLRRCSMKHVLCGKNRLVMTGVILCLLSAATAILCGIRFHEMASPSMEPLIHGRTVPNQRGGDLLLVMRQFSVIPLRQGDLLVIDFQVPGQREHVQTVRELAALPGQKYTDGDGAVRELEAEHFWAVAKTNGIDSLAFGPIGRDQIVGRVLHVFHRSTRCRY